MKRKILLFYVSLILISGCGNKDTSKSLRCEKSEIVSDNSITEVIMSTFEDEQIKTADIKIETVVAEKYIPFMESLEEELKLKYNDYYNKQGISINTVVGTNMITTKINFDFDFIDDSAMSLLNLNNIISTYEETKLSLENSGYVCK